MDHAALYAERLKTPQRPLPFVHMVRGRHVIDHQD